MQRRELKFRRLLRCELVRMRCLSCRGVNWNSPCTSSSVKPIYGCLSCRGVNWNISGANVNNGSNVASHAEAWIEIKKIRHFLPLLPRCLSCRGVNWNSLLSFNLLVVVVASHAEAWIEICVWPANTFVQLCCLSCRGVNWNFWHVLLCLLARCCLSCRGVNWN